MENEYCHCDRIDCDPDKADNGRYYCNTCMKEINPPEPEYNGDEDLAIDERGDDSGKDEMKRGDENI